MNLLYKFFIFLFFSTLFSKSFIPSDANKDESVLILDKKKSYRYYELNENGLNYSNLDGFSSQDSIRIKLFIRQIMPQENSKEQNFGIELSLNDEAKSLLYTDKKNALRKISGRPGWSCTDAGVWFIDIMYKDFEKLTIKEINKNKVKELIKDKKRVKRFLNDDLIVRAQVKKINRAKSTPRIVNTINIESKFQIDTFNTDSNNNQSLISRDWYRLEHNKDELQFEIIGPTSIRIFSRIGLPSPTSNNEYHIFVKEDGLDIGNFQFTTELSSMSNLAKTGEKVSKWRTCWINVPKGKHYYTIRKGVKFNSFNNHEADHSNREQNSESNPIYIRVKRYDKN